MTTTELTRHNSVAMSVPDLPSYEVMEKVLGTGDIASLTPKQKVEYYINLCQSIGLNPMSRPFEFVAFQGKVVPYAKKDAADQLRKMHSVSITKLERVFEDGMYTVTAHALLPSGRSDESTGVVCIGNLQGEARANAYMKAETKAKRRVTMSICGLGFLDESEIDSIPGAQRVRFEPQTGDMELPKLEPVVDYTHERKLLGDACSAIIASLDTADKASAQKYIKDNFSKAFSKFTFEDLQKLREYLQHEFVERALSVPQTFGDTVRSAAGLPSDCASGEGYVSDSAKPADDDDPFADS